MKFKPSNFNIYVSTGKPDEFVLYNSLHDSILVVDTEMKETIQSHPEKLESEEKEVLTRMGLILSKDYPEEKILRLKYNQTKYNTGFYTLFVVLPTFACNLACNYCYEGSGEILNHSMDTKTLDLTIRFIKNQTKDNRSKTILLKIYGGEPIINYDGVKKIFIEIHDWCKKNGIEFNIILQTNGTLLDKSRILELKPYLKMGSVELTLDGPKSRHDKTRITKKGEGTYDLIMNTLTNLISEDIVTILRLNVENKKELEDLLEDLTQRGFKNKPGVNFYTARTSDYSLCQFFSDEKLCEDDQTRALDLAPDLHEMILSSGWKPQHKQPDVIQKQKFVACNNEKAGRYTIDPWGSIYTCFFRAGDERYRAGKLIDKGTVKWEPLYYNMITRNPLSFEECAECKYFPFCGGGCSMRAFEKTGEFNKNYCGSIKELMPRRILLYLQKKYPDKFTTRR